MVNRPRLKLMVVPFAPQRGAGFLDFLNPKKLLKKAGKALDYGIGKAGQIAQIAGQMSAAGQRLRGGGRKKRAVRKRGAGVVARTTRAKRSVAVKPHYGF